MWLHAACVSVVFIGFGTVTGTLFVLQMMSFVVVGGPSPAFHGFDGFGYGFVVNGGEGKIPLFPSCACFFFPTPSCLCYPFVSLVLSYHIHF